jgi:hypothetical protein
VFRPGRDARWQYAGETIEAIEGWNCSKGRGCIRGAAPGSPAHEEFGPGGTCDLLADVFLRAQIDVMDDDGEVVTCRAYEERPDDSIPAGQLTIEEVR